MIRLAAYFGDAETTDVLIRWHNFLTGIVGALEPLTWIDVARVGQRYALGSLVRWAAGRLRRDLLTMDKDTKAPKRPKPAVPARPNRKPRDLGAKLSKIIGRVVDKFAGLFGFSYAQRLKQYRKQLVKDYGLFAPKTDDRGLPFVFGFDGCGLAVGKCEKQAQNGKSIPWRSLGYLAPHPGLPSTMGHPHLGKLLKNDVISAISLLGSMLAVQQGDEDEDQADAGEHGQAGSGFGEEEPVIPDGMVLAENLGSIAAVDLEIVD